MDLQELANRTGLPLRKLRYVVDHNLVPGLNYKLAESEAGRPRRFAPDVGFGIACVTALLHAGLQRTAATEFVAAMLDVPFRWPSGKMLYGHQVLSEFCRRGSEGRMFLADGVNVKIDVKISDATVPAKWCEPHTGATLAEEYEPRVVVELDIGRLRREIFGAPDG